MHAQPAPHAPVQSSWALAIFAGSLWTQYSSISSGLKWHCNNKIFFVYIAILYKSDFEKRMRMRMMVALWTRILEIGNWMYVDWNWDFGGNLEARSWSHWEQQIERSDGK